MKSFQTVCIDIEASPLLGGTLIAITEGVVEFGFISICMYSNSMNEIDVKRINSILLMALDIEGVVGSSYSFRDETKVSYGSCSKHIHINNGRVIDSPARLVEIATNTQIRQVLKFKPEIYLSAIDGNVCAIVVIGKMKSNVLRKLNIICITIFFLLE